MKNEKVNSSEKIIRYLLRKVKEKELPPELVISHLKEIKSAPKKENDQIAIVGMGCRFPDADHPDEFWDNLAAGKSSIKSFPKLRKEDYERIKQDNLELMRAGFLESVDSFDPEYFNIPPRVAEQLDPYHRLMLQVFIETIEDAGYHQGQLKGRKIGVYVGNDHTHRFVNSYLSFMSESEDEFPALTGSWTGILASRLSYLLNLRGPAMVVDTACSSSLVALDTAIKSIKNGDCEAALVGGINLMFAPGSFGEDLQSDESLVHAFDYRGDGTVWGEGVGAVYIKTLSKAIADGDHIYGIVRGISVNNDGSTNGLTSPSAKAQQEVLLKAWERAGISPETISYIETHGTGTELGDPIEIKGLTNAFSKHTNKRQFCAIGSVKTNIGHTVGVAGMASMIKVILSIKNKALPPSLNFSQPNAFIDFCNSPVYVQNRLSDWPSKNGPRRAGISSFSLSGTNVHLVIEEYTSSTEQRSKQEFGIFPLSGRTVTLLKESIQRHIHYLNRHTELQWEDICYTAATGREHQKNRVIILCQNKPGMITGLERINEYLSQENKNMNEDSTTVLRGKDYTVFFRFDVTEHRKKDETSLKKRAQILTTELQETKNNGDQEMWEELCTLFAQGMEINMEHLFSKQHVKRCSLPPQPFKKERYWNESYQVSQKIVPAVTDQPEQDDDYRTSLWEKALSSPSCLKGIHNLDDEIARFIAWVWSEVLGYPEIHIQDDFYSLGGDSVTGLRIIQTLHDVFNIDIPLSHLMEHSTFNNFVEKLLNEYSLNKEMLYANTLSEEDEDTTANGEVTHVLTPAQNRMFLTSRLAQQSVAYNVTGVQSVKESISVEDIEAVFRKLIQRHESLRTSFHLDGESPVQIVHPEVDFQLERRTLTVQENKTIKEQIQENLNDFIRPFDLEKAPLFRVRYIECNEEAYLAVDMHHIITDGTSMGVLFNDFISLAEGKKLSPIKLRTKEIVEWFTNQEKQDQFIKKGKWWRDMYRDEIPVLELPTDRQRPAMRNFKGGKIFHTIPLHLAEQLKDVSKASEVSMYMLLFGAFHHLLSRLSGNNDIVIGSPVTGRPRLDFQNLVGMFINTLPIRFQSKENERFSDFLSRLKHLLLEVYENQEYPYEALINDLNVERNPGRNPLFDVYFSYQNIDMGLTENEEDMIHYDSETTKFDLTLSIRKSSKGLLMEWEYSTALFNEETIKRMALRYQSLLTSIVKNPSIPLKDISIMRDHEAHQLLEEWNHTTTSYPHEQGIIPIFNEMVKKYGDSIALVMGKDQMTYKELNRRSNQIAHGIMKQGISSGSPVALLLDRSFDMIAAILGVLKAGCFYVPLEINFPAKRLEVMLNDCQARLLITHNDLEHRIPHELNNVLSVLNLCELDSSLSNENVDIEMTGDSLAYIMYTSGSTGVPKGTKIRQKGVIRVARNTNYLTIYPQDVLLQLSNYSFDGSTFDIFGALLNGARLVLLRDEDVIDPKALTKQIQENNISIFFITTALFNALIDASPECFDNTRKVLFGGESASIQHVKKAYQRLGPDRLIHVYGPTETTVFATYYPVNKIEEETIPIGRAISNTTLYVLDKQRRLQPIGVPGELYIGGPGLAAGYLNQPDLTDEHFIKNPFNTEEMIYRTGDIVVWQDDGNLKFLGRNDEQIKLRGFRITLSEIESTVLNMPDVQDVCAGIHQTESGADSLCIWVVPTDSVSTFDSSKLRKSLIETLPEYMVPSFILPLKALPLNKNGKIDRNKLPFPIAEQKGKGNESHNKKEVLLLDIWQKVLGIRPKVNDNFFTLGGDSIKAIQVVAQVQKAGFSLEMSDLFQYQTVETLAPHVKERQSVLAVQGEITGDIPANAIQTWFLDRESIPDHFTQAMKIHGIPKVDVETLKIALGRLCHHHDALRLTVNTNGGMYIRGYDEKNLFYVEEMPSDLSEDMIYTYLIKLQKHHLHVNNGPLIVAALNSTQHVLYIAIHHLAVDVVSWGIILEDLFTLISTPDAQLPPKTTSVLDWNRSLINWANNGGAEDELPYWRKLANKTKQVPPPFKEKRFQELEKTTVKHRIAGEIGHALCETANDAFFTETMHLVLTVFTRAFSMYKKVPSLLVNLEGHGREKFTEGLDTSRTVGWFTTTFPVLIDALGETGEVIKSVKESVRSVPRNGFGFGVLKSLSTTISLEDKKLFDDIKPVINFNYLGRQDNMGQDEIKVEALPTEVTVDPSFENLWMLDIIAYQEDATICYEIRYPKALFGTEDINRLANLLDDVAKEVVEFCLTRNNREKTASDFSISSLNQEELESIYADLNIE